MDIGVDLATIATAISTSSGQTFAPSSVGAVDGGSIHSAWRLADDTRRFFVKTGRHSATGMFEAEARALDALAATGALRTPKVVAQGQAGGGAYLVLEYIDLQALDHAGGARLGHALAQLHRNGGEAFGWCADNFIGVTPQRNEAHPNWARFFGECRLRPQLELARENGMDKALAAQGMGLIERIGGLFIDYRPLPSLLHGDLWSGNAAQTADGTPVIFDPACYYGDRETDIAMTELFGGFPTSFYVTYRAAWPLDRGYETRKPLYNLYHVLNHFNLFGGAYLGQARRMIESLTALLRR